MVATLLARVDGLPVTLLDRQVVWPIPAGERNGRRSPMTSKRRARIERQTAVVHAAVLPASLRALVAEQAAEAERLEIRSELGRRRLSGTLQLIPHRAVPPSSDRARTPCQDPSAVGCRLSARGPGASSNL